MQDTRTAMTSVFEAQQRAQAEQSVEAAEALRDAAADLMEQEALQLLLAYNAYRFHLFGEDERSQAELDQIEEILLQLQETSGERLGPELVEPLGMVEQIRASLSGDRSGVPLLLEDLARRLNQMALKGELILSER